MADPAKSDKDDGKEEKSTARATFFKPTEFEIEFGDDRNRVMAWPPTSEILRGSWKRSNLISDELVEDLSGMPDIPGLRLRIDPARGKSVIYDPLSMPENKEVCEKIQRVVKARFRVDQGPAKAVERDKMDKDDLKTWYYWAARKVANRQARVVAGTLPSIAEIERMEGRIRIEMYNSSARACKWKEEFDKYVDFILSAGRPQTV